MTAWKTAPEVRDDRPVLPDYDGACTANLLSTLVDEIDDPPEWCPPEVRGANQVVLLVIDGLGWNQLVERIGQLRALPKLSGRAITTVCPTTTSTGLTSITTGLTPAEHGVIGYRMAVKGEILNVLRWSTGRGDARETIDPLEIQPVEAFESQRYPAVTRAEFVASGFTEAHLNAVRFVGYRMPSTLNCEVLRLLAAGEPFVYAYYDGIDKVAHEYGLGDHYDAELAAVDGMIAHLAASLPRDAILVVTADHGQVDVGDNGRELPSDVQSMLALQSGEGRFRWLHSVPGAQVDLANRCAELYSHEAWVVTREQTLDERWFGSDMSDRVRAYLGDVALVARDPIYFSDPADTGPFQLQSRHGSMTADEVLVPMLVARG